MMTIRWEHIDVRKDGLEKTPCDCCGKTTLVIEGDLYRQDAWIGFYWVRMAEGHPEQLPTFHIGTGNWAEEARSEDRWVIAVEYSKDAEGFRAIDVPNDGSTATFLKRDEWISTDFASEAVAILDAIYMKDDRLAELRP